MFVCLLIFLGVYFYFLYDGLSGRRSDRVIAGAQQVATALPGSGVGEILQFGAVGGPVTPQTIIMVTNTPEATATPGREEAVAEPTAIATLRVDALPEGYTRVRIVGRFSNYWPRNGGINGQGDYETFADGSRVDLAVNEQHRVVACPNELLLGTRIEFPPGSGVIWQCRDRGAAITFYYSEAGLPIYWFDFLWPDPFVDYGSYIQVDLFVPCNDC